jgi:hypothetical protein
LAREHSLPSVGQRLDDIGEAGYPCGLLDPGPIVAMFDRSEGYVFVGRHRIARRFLRHDGDGALPLVGREIADVGSGDGDSTGGRIA